MFFTVAAVERQKIVMILEPFVCVNCGALKFKFFCIFSSNFHLKN
jgi:hypothetical protein